MASFKRRSTSTASPAPGETPTLLKLRLNEIGQNAAEQAIFREQLVDGRRLRVTQLSEFLCLGDHGRVRDHGLGLGCPKVGGKLLDQCRDVIEQMVRREHLVRVHRQHPFQSLEPARGDCDVFSLNPFGNQSAEVGGSQVGQGNLFP